MVGFYITSVPHPNGMGVIQRLKRAMAGEASSGVTYSIGTCVCEACGTAFESKTAPKHAHCPNCESTDIYAADPPTDN